MDSACWTIAPSLFGVRRRVELLSRGHNPTRYPELPQHCLVEHKRFDVAAHQCGIEPFHNQSSVLPLFKLCEDSYLHNSLLLVRVRMHLTNTFSQIVVIPNRTGDAAGLVGAVGFEPTQAVASTTVSEWPLNQT